MHARSTQRPIATTWSQIRFPRGLILPAVLSLAALSACGGGAGDREDGDEHGGNGGTSGASGTSGNSGNSGNSGQGGAPPGTVVLGDSCQTDNDCEAGLACLAPLLGGSDRYCARTCATGDSCVDLAEASYNIQVPLTVNSQGGDPFTNIWNTAYLQRATACAPKGGQSGQPLYCQYGCPNFSAAVISAAGEIVDCACLPGYRLNATRDGCEFDQETQCSIFSYTTAEDQARLQNDYGVRVAATACTACNSDMSFTDGLDCHTARFMCELTSNGLNGRCAEILTVDELIECASSDIYTSCDCNCPTPEACGQDAFDRYDCACCTCTKSGSKPARPVCNGTGGTNGTGGSAGTSGEAGTSGAAGTAGAAGSAAGGMPNTGGTTATGGTSGGRGGNAGASGAAGTGTAGSAAGGMSAAGGTTANGGTTPRGGAGGA